MAHDFAHSSDAQSPPAQSHKIPPSTGQPPNIPSPQAQLPHVPPALCTDPGQHWLQQPLQQPLRQWLNGTLVLSWLWLNWPTLQWFGESLLEQSRFNQLFLAAVALLLAVQAVRTRLPGPLAGPLSSPPNSALADSLQALELEAKPTPILPVSLLLGSAVAALGARWLLDFEQVPAVLFLLGSYSLAGLFLPQSLWRKGLPAASAVAIVVPFWMQFTSGLGFPARILTAQAVEALLKIWHVTALSSEDIIVLDTGIAQVDLPCSGLKSLWMGTVLLLGMTWLEKRQIGLRWLLVWGANLGLLVVANIARVLTLVLLIYVLQQPALADVVHLPLGIISFVTVSLIAWGLLRWIPQVQEQESGMQRLNGTASLRSQTRQSRTMQSQIRQSRTSSQNRRSVELMTGLLTLSLLALSLSPRPVAELPVLPALSQLNWPAALQVESMPLTEPEQSFFVTYDGVVAEKQRFNFHPVSGPESELKSGPRSESTPGISGSMILVGSPTWQAHHSPELCYIGNGFRINQMWQQQLTTSVLGRWLLLDQNQTGYAATYWFQSPDRTTDSYLNRLWAELTRQEQSWTMVSILFDQPYSPETPGMRAFLNQVQMTLDHA